MCCQQQTQAMADTPLLCQLTREKTQKKKSVGQFLQHTQVPTLTFAAAAPQELAVQTQTY